MTLKTAVLVLQGVVHDPQNAQDEGAKDPPVSPPQGQRPRVHLRLGREREAEGRLSRCARQPREPPRISTRRDTPCKDFDITCLELVRKQMEAERRTDETTPKLARSTINWRINLIRTVFRKSVEVFKLVPATVWNELRALSALGAGQTDARETDEVPAVTEGHVEAVLSGRNPKPPFSR